MAKMIAFEEEAYSLGLAGVREYDTSVMRFTYSSMTTPTEIYDYDMRTRERVLRKRQEVPSGHDPKAYRTRRVFADAPDGAFQPRVPLPAGADRPDCPWYFWSGHGTGRAAIRDVSRTLAAVFKTSGVTNAHAHRSVDGDLRRRQESLTFPGEDAVDMDTRPAGGFAAREQLRSRPHVSPLGMAT